MKRIATTLLVAGLLAMPVLVLPPSARAAISIGIAVNMAPPPLPVYAQPMVPGPGYIWTPGYWGWDPGYGYYWVPGTWVMPPQVGLLWTPGWWGWSNDAYRWNAGYWGTNVGFYGGVNYGFGYYGTGYSGGRWRGNQFYYNRAVNNINVTNIHNIYVDKTVINHANARRVSYNGGRGGLSARPSAQQRGYGNQHRVQPTAVQAQQRDVAMRDPAQRFKTNQGKPAVFATQRAGNFSGPHAVRAPASAPGRMAEAPKKTPTTTPTSNREHGMVEAPRNRAQPKQPVNREAAQNRPQPAKAANRGMVEAPRNRAQPKQPVNRERSMAEAPRNRAQPQQPANRNAKVVQAPNQRPMERAPAKATAPRPETERARPAARPQERQAPTNERRPEPTRAEHAASPRPQQARNPRNEKHPPKSSGGGR